MERTKEEAHWLNKEVLWCSLQDRGRVKLYVQKMIFYVIVKMYSPGKETLET